MSLDEFAHDTRTRYAVQMALMIMGEAGQALPPEMHRRHVGGRPGSPEGGA